MNDMQSMRMAYTELSGMNTSLISSYSIRAQNHNTLLGSLKEVNQMIQKAANLRAGKAKTLLIAECRAAVKANNLQIIKNSVKYGHKKI
jgi:Bardet-Biedl syndrome 2 protein